MIRMMTLVAGLAVALTGSAVAATVDFNQILSDADGKMMTDCETVSETPPYLCTKTTELTLRRLAVSALDYLDPQKREGAVEKLKRGILAQDIIRAKGPMTLTADDIKLIKDQIAAMPSVKPTVVVSAVALLDPDSLVKSK